LLQRGANGVAMFSKSGENLARYFPEILESAAQLREEHFCLDGELVIPIGDRFSFVLCFSVFIPLQAASNGWRRKRRHCFLPSIS
jgi:ATP-dependent DNA ligase